MPEVSLEEFNGAVGDCLTVEDWREERLGKETAFHQQVIDEHFNILLESKEIVNISAEPKTTL